MISNIRNNLGLLLVFFNIIKKIYILSFFKSQIYSSIPVYLSYSTITDQQFLKLQTILVSALVFSFIIIVFLVNYLKKSAFPKSKLSRLAFIVLVVILVLFIIKYRIQRFLAKKIQSLYFYYKGLCLYSTSFC